MTVVEFLKSCSNGRVDVVHNYSGRGMYGRQCPAIIGTEYDCMDLLFEAVRNDPRAFDEYRLKDWSKDNMGYDYVYYWRHLSVDNSAGLW